MIAETRQHPVFDLERLMNTAEGNRPSALHLPAWLTPPVIAGDEEATRVAGLAFWLIVPLMVVTIIAPGFSYATEGVHRLESMVKYIVPALAIELVALVLLQTRHVRIASV